MRVFVRLFSLLLVSALLLPVVPANAADSGARRVLLTPTASPATSQYVSWSRRSAASGQKVVAVGPDGSVKTAAAVKKQGTTERLSGSRQVRYVAQLTRLSANSSYRYRIVTRSGKTPWRTFRTAPSTGGDFAFLQFGDTQVRNAQIPTRIIDAAVAKTPSARLLVHAGDVVNHPWVGREWSDLHAALTPSGQSKNWLAAIGNHEQCILLKSCRSGQGQGFRAYFHGASNGYAKQRRTWFYVDYGAARFIVLDSFGNDLPRQRAFLAKALATNNQPWSIVVMHAGPFASDSKRNNDKIRKAFLPTLEKYGADLVLSGHDHSYARGSKAGVTYLTSVSGPKYYDSGAADWQRGGAVREVAAYRTSTYQSISVTSTELKVSAIVGHRAKGAWPQTTVGQVLDTFTLQAD